MVTIHRNFTLFQPLRPAKYCGYRYLWNEKSLNPKHEIRNPKQYRMTEIQMIQTKDIPGIAILRLFLSLELLIFEFVSYFDIRISKFV